MKIIGAHLFNDYSGSPLVFSQLLTHWSQKQQEVLLYTSSQKGRLSNIQNIRYRLYRYQWSKNKLVTLFKFLKVNLYLFISILFTAKKSDIVYVNTLLPFGAALAAKVKGASVVYHKHETSVQPKSFKAFLKKVQKFTVDKTIYVSRFLKELEGENGKGAGYVVHNSLSDDFIGRAEQHLLNGDKKPENVLMLASLREYKGVKEFFELAVMLPQYPFELLLNADKLEIGTYLESHRKPDNLIIHEAVEDVHPFYCRAKVVLNLSRPDEWAETFGMTSVEAMKYGIPVIFPPVGGPVEIVKPDFGFLISCYQLDEMAQVITKLYSNDLRYQSLSAGALKTVTSYYPASFLQQVDQIIQS